MGLWGHSYGYPVGLFSGYGMTGNPYLPYHYNPHLNYMSSSLYSNREQQGVMQVRAELFISNLVGSTRIPYSPASVGFRSIQMGVKA